MTAPARRPIPHPPEKPIVGNAFDIASDRQTQDTMELAREYGEIFSIAVGGFRVVFVSSHRLVDELSDETRFDKRVWAPLQQVRAFAGDGLFTAHTFEPNWRLAHSILMPSFSMAAMKRYHPMMLDIAEQMMERWERLNPEEEIDVADEMTRLTLDTIGLCGFDYRFNSFYKERMHPFVRAMTRSLSIAMERSGRPKMPKEFFFRENKRLERAVDLMNRTVDKIIQERRAAGVDLAVHDDLLAHMLVGRDRETGQGLDDLNIRYQIITFLIAGHETTSGTLAFATYFLLKHPEVLERAREEVDRVFGTDTSRQPTYRQVTELRYVRQVLDESLRLWPTAPMFSLFPKEGRTYIGGDDKTGYEIDKTQGLVVLTPMLHRDPEVWGDDVERFDPDRFAPEQVQGRPVNAYKPFGNGQRACIGRQFAMHEATLALGMILQRFDLVDSRNYELKVKETLTLKPDDFHIQVRRRVHERASAAVAVAAPDLSGEAPAVAESTASEPAAVPQHATPLLVLYGSNMGTAEGVAHRLAEGGEARGFAVTIAPLDEYAGALPTEGAVCIVTASYNGTPPDNARRFVDWLRSGDLESDALRGVNYSVFGCGHRDWAATYQQVPQLIDALLAEHGANRVHERGEGDGSADFDGDFEAWYQPLWPQVVEVLDLSLDLEGARARPAAFEVEVVNEHHPNPFVAQFSARPMVVVENRELQAPGAERSTRHIELAVPPGVAYEAGDHLGVIAHNDSAIVRRVAERFAFDEQTRIKVFDRGGHADFPTGEAIAVHQLLRDYVELQEPATRKQIQTLADHTRCPHTSAALEALIAADDEGQARYRAEVLERRKSLIDLLDEFPACEVPFGVYLSLLPPLRPRYYSISSSPRATGSILSLTVAVVEAPALSGHGIFKGVASNYLALKEKGSSVYAFVRDSATPFRPPPSLAVPMIMVGPGTGIAPFRGFLQERACAMEEGRPVAGSLLFFGCRHPDHDWLYRDEIAAFEKKGVVLSIQAFSRAQKEKVYVQDRIREHGDQVWDLLEEGAVVYVCGDAGEMAPAVRRALAEVWRAKKGGDEAAAEAWLEDLAERGRYHVDVWAS